MTPAVQAAKIKELDSEVRKLWDNVWKESKKRLAALEATMYRHAENLEFEEAARVRDEIQRVRDMGLGPGVAPRSGAA